MKILVTGVPGVGKTTISNELSNFFRLIHLNVSEEIKNSKIYSEYSAEYDTYEFCPDKVSEALIEKYKDAKNIVIDTHTPEVAKWFDLDLIVCVFASNADLIERYKNRGYNELKISENIDSQIFNVIGEDLEEYFPDIRVINVKTSKEYDSVDCIDSSQLLKHMVNIFNIE